MTEVHEALYRRQMEWAQRMVAWITNYTTGVPREMFTFEEVWDRAVETCGKKCPAGGLQRDDPQSVPFYDFFRRACEREWHGLETTDFAGLEDSSIEGEPIPRLTVPVPA